VEQWSGELDQTRPRSEGTPGQDSSGGNDITARLGKGMLTCRLCLCEAAVGTVGKLDMAWFGIVQKNFGIELVGTSSVLF